MSTATIQPRMHRLDEPQRLRTSMPDREAQARAEVGQTAISRGMAWALFGAFMLTMLAVPLVQHVRDLREHSAGGRARPLPQAYDIFYAAPPTVAAFREQPGSLVSKVFAANRVLLGHILDYEDALEDESVVGKWIRPRMQTILSGWIGAGNEKAYVGREGWLFYRPEIEYLTGEGFLDPVVLARRARAGSETVASIRPDPRIAVLEFHRALAARGTKLVLFPVPVKPMIQPEQFASGIGSQSLLQNASYEQFKRELQEEGVLVFDPSQRLMEAKKDSAAAQYLKTDTHWTPSAMDLTASHLKTFLETHAALSSVPDPGYRREARQVENLGDIAVMLQLPAGQTLYPPETVTIQEVGDSKGAPWRPTRSSDVLLLGDSFTNIYSYAEMGWGEGAGFAEQLSFHLKRPIDALTRNDAGAFATRQMLSRELAQGRDRLEGKKVVIWEFAMRELAAGDWKHLEMKLGQAAPSKFVVPAPGRQTVVSGVISSVTPAPRPGSVPYKDHLVSVHLTDLRDESGPIPGGQALVYMWSMRDAVWTDAARYRPGQTLKVQLKPWSDVSDRLGAVNRTEPADEALLFETPTYGEAIK